MVYLESASFDPQFNLALEEYVFNKLDRGQNYFMLWQNDNAVIVGKYQNTAKEVDMAYVNEHGIRVVRRLSGGGAVYHDLGNLNFTIIVDAADAGRLDFSFFATPLIEMLKTFGVQAEATGRNDITVDGAKFSGNAQYKKEGRVMHHGTILFNSDLSVVSKALKVPEDKFRDKAVKSVRSRVTNLKPYLGDASLEDVKEAFKTQMDKVNGLVPYQFSEADLDAARALSEARYATWEWNFGASPAYAVTKRRRFAGVGAIEVSYQQENGCITAFASTGDYFGEGGDAPALQGALLGTKLEPGALKEALAELDMGRFYNNLSAEDFVTLLLE